MAKQIRLKKNGSKFDEKIEVLQTVADSLLEEVKSLKISTNIELENGIDFYEKVGKYEVYLIETALEKTGGSQAKAARLLNLKPSTLNMKMKNLKIVRR